MLGSDDTAVNVGVNAETHIRLANGLVAIEVDLEKAVTPTQATGIRSARSTKRLSMARPGIPYGTL